MQKRKIIRIDEEKCNGCGVCVPSCAEGALKIIDGKARLVSDVYCDGLGACLGECPEGALEIVERDAPEFDQAEVDKFLAKEGGKPHAAHGREVAACPGSAPVSVEREEPAAPRTAGAAQSRLGNWPVQLYLAPVAAPFYQGADLLIAADCVPFAAPDFHEGLLAGRVLLIGCPKLDEADEYKRKLEEIFKTNDIKSVSVAYMEVPCCFGLVHLVTLALKDSGKKIPAALTKVSIKGQVVETKSVEV